MKLRYQCRRKIILYLEDDSGTIWIHENKIFLSKIIRLKTFASFSLLPTQHDAISLIFWSKRTWIFNFWASEEVRDSDNVIYKKHTTYNVQEKSVAVSSTHGLPISIFLSSFSQFYTELNNLQIWQFNETMKAKVTWLALATVVVKITLYATNDEYMIGILFP